MPADHFSLIIPEDKIDSMVDFLTHSLQHLGFKEHVRYGPYVVGMGETVPYFWLAAADGEDMDAKTMQQILKKTHIAFTAKTDEQVKTFYDAALKVGATDNGPPGPRPQYGPGYYGAFVLDPVCGVNFEVVCHNRGDASTAA